MICNILLKTVLVHYIFTDSIWEDIVSVTCFLHLTGVVLLFVKACFLGLFTEYFLEDIVQILNFIPAPDLRKRKKDKKSSARDDDDDDDYGIDEDEVM